MNTAQNCRLRRIAIAVLVLLGMAALVALAQVSVMVPWAIAGTPG